MIEDQVDRLTPLALGSTRLADSGEQKLTILRQTDARSALTRGLAEYLRGLSIAWEDGRFSRFLQVYENWAEPEDEAVYPTAIVYALESGSYDASVLTPTTVLIPNTDIYLREVAELVQPLSIEIWCTDPMERMAMVAMLEDALEPHEFMTGLRLELPHYHGQRATYEKVSISYADSTDNAQRRWRQATFSVQASITQLKVIGKLPKLDLRIALTVDNFTEVVVPSSVAVDATTVVVYMPGPVGKSGRDGRDGSGSAFTHVQAVPALVWTINHNLGYFPSIEVWDSLGREVEADVLNVTITQATVTFLAASTGSARCV